MEDTCSGVSSLFFIMAECDNTGSRICSILGKNDFSRTDQSTRRNLSGKTSWAFGPLPSMKIGPYRRSVVMNT